MSAKPDLGYEEARDRLIEIVRQLESGNVPVSQALELWEQGEALASFCQQWLDGAAARIDAAKGPAAAGQAAPE